MTVKAKKSLGQNFLIDRNVLSQIVDTVKIEGNKAIIKNFLGEKIQRESSIPEGAEMEIKKDIIIIKSLNKEIAGQTAANLEIATKVRGRDKRIFQDGIYIVEKCGRAI